MAHICNILILLIYLSILLPSAAGTQHPHRDPDGFRSVADRTGRILHSEGFSGPDRPGQAGAGLQLAQKDAAPSRAMQPAASGNRTAPLMLRNISVRFGPAGRERVLIEFNREVIPAISSIGGQEPRIVVDVGNVLSMRQGLRRIEIGGTLVRQIRSNLEQTSRQLRIVVDLVPSKHYDVEPVFYRAEKVYMLDIREAPEKR